MAEILNFVRSRSFFTVALCAMIISLVLLITDVTLADQSDRDAKIRVAQEFIDVAQAKYDRGLYDSALKMLEQLSSEYDDVLTGKSQKQINDLTVKIEEAKKAAAKKDSPVVVAEEVVAEVEAPKEEKVVEVATAQPEVEVVVEPVQIAPEVEVVQVAPKTQTDENSYVKVVQRKRARQRDYTRAVVNNAIKLAQDYALDSNFSKARSSLAIAYANIDKNKMLLGDVLYSDYKTQMDQLSSSIEQNAFDKAEAESLQELAETEQLQQNIRKNMEEQRINAVREYFDNSLAFQKEQRYQESLAQIEALLAIDPLNHMALIQKQSLEDIIIWREQNVIQKDKYEQEIRILLETDRSTIPYADEMAFPKNWNELVGKRKSDQDMAVDPVNYAVYRQLDQEADFSMLTEETTFAEAIEIIKTSVDPTLKIIVLWGDLEENAYIEQDTPINVTVPGKVKIKVALKLILDSVAGGFAEIDYAVNDGVIKIATVDSLPDRMEIRQYSIAELLGRPASFVTEMDNTDMGYQGDSGGSGGSRSSSSQNDQNMTGDELGAQNDIQVNEILTLIQDTVDADSWYDAGGEATITNGPNNKLVIKQTPENHMEIAKLLKGLRSSLGQQVAIEARFLIVSENFIERLGVDFDFTQNLGSRWGTWAMNQNSSNNTVPGATGVPGSLGGAGMALSSLSGGYGTIFDDLQASFMIDAVQAHRDATTLNAPKVTVLNGESATISITTTKSYIEDFEFENITQSGDNQNTTVLADPEIGFLYDGVVLNVTPTITADKKYVILNVTTTFSNTNLDKSYSIPADNGSYYQVDLPESQIADVKTRVLVPDCGTLLIGGQKLAADINIEEGVPVLSKLPFVGRLFENRSQVKDSNVLLILIKPTLMFYDELEENATGMMK